MKAVESLPSSLPDWDPPVQYGYAAAIESMGATAAPFLGGFGIALATLVMSSPGSFRHPNAALLLLVWATFSLLGSLQCTFWGRCYLVTPAELNDWWGSSLQNPTRFELVQGEQRRAKQSHERWSARASMLYDIGILALLLAIPVLLIPPSGFTAMRLAVFALALAGVLLEIRWIAETRYGLISRIRAAAFS